MFICLPILGMVNVDHNDIDCKRDMTNRAILYQVLPIFNKEANSKHNRDASRRYQKYMT